MCIRDSLRPGACRRPGRCGGQLLLRPLRAALCEGLRPAGHRTGHLWPLRRRRISARLPRPLLKLTLVVGRKAHLPALLGKTFRRHPGRTREGGPEETDMLRTTLGTTLAAIALLAMSGAAYAVDDATSENAAIQLDQNNDPNAESSWMKQAPNALGACFIQELSALGSLFWSSWMASFSLVASSTA